MTPPGRGKAYLGPVRPISIVWELGQDPGGHKRPRPPWPAPPAAARTSRGSHARARPRVARCTLSVCGPGCFACQPAALRTAAAPSGVVRNLSVTTPPGRNNGSTTPPDTRLDRGRRARAARRRGRALRRRGWPTAWSPTTANASVWFSYVVTPWSSATSWPLGAHHWPTEQEPPGAGSR
jgi:hypothetical protein